MSWEENKYIKYTYASCIEKKKQTIFLVSLVSMVDFGDVDDDIVL